jgi:hypothetical protein
LGIRYLIKIILIVCGIHNCVAFVDVVGNLVWMSAGVYIMVGFLDDAVVVGIIGNMAIFQHLLEMPLFIENNINILKVYFDFP